MTDIISRDTGANELAGVLQQGPNFMREPEDSWPIQQSCSSDELPEELQLQALMMAEIPSAKSCNEILDTSRFSS